MTNLRTHRLLFFLAAVSAATALTGTVAYATCQEGEKGDVKVELTPDKWHGFSKQKQTFTVKNSGTLELTALEISLISPKNGLVMTSKTCGKTLAVGATCNVTVECVKQDEASLSAIQYTPFTMDTSVLQCLVI